MDLRVGWSVGIENLVMVLKITIISGQTGLDPTLCGLIWLWQAVDAIALKLAKVLVGTKAKPPRWRKCLTDSNSKKISKENLKYPLKSYPHPSFAWTTKAGVLPHLVASMYVRKHFNMDSKKVADEMVSDLRWLLKSTLDNWEKNLSPRCQRSCTSLS